MLKRKYIRVFFILLLTILPVALDFAISHDAHFPIIWSIFLIPSTLLIFSSPNWKTVIATGLFYTTLKYVTELSQEPHLHVEESIILVWSSVINWSIHLVTGYLRIQNEKLLEKVHSLTLVDHLTEIYNRRYVELYMERTLPYVLKNDRLFLAAALDIDHFKKINDQYGHLCGDEALKHFVSIVKGNIRETDMFARVGGEEFLLTFIDTPLEEAKTRIEHIRKKVACTPFHYKGQVISMTVSLGLTEYEQGSFEQLLKKADDALYQAKETGRNKWVVA